MTDLIQRLREVKRYTMWWGTSQKPFVLASDYDAALEAQQRRIGELESALQKFVSYYPCGVNPYLDEAYREAKDALSLALASKDPPLHAKVRTPTANNPVIDDVFGDDCDPFL